jgi:hypothetical protein
MMSRDESKIRIVKCKMCNSVIGGLRKGKHIFCTNTCRTTYVKVLLNNDKKESLKALLNRVIV